MRRRILPLAIAAVLAAAGCGGDEPERTYVLDEVRGSFRGVTLGDREREVIGRFGPDQGEPAGPVRPLGDGGDLAPGTFASTPGPPRPDDRTAALRYPGMSFVTNDRRVYVVMSTLEGTETTRGVRIGDDLDAARERYPLECDEATDAHGAGTFPYCRGHEAGRPHVYFGGDPIGAIAVARVPLYGG
ncbi:MAG TPA: hypothetical protein VHF89_17925 [Solirubrobacteraceae bacterium]|nr:hypothetical protein [Solirubrobacteraceae bacterium]